MCVVNFLVISSQGKMLCEFDVISGLQIKTTCTCTPNLNPNPKLVFTKLELHNMEIPCYLLYSGAHPRHAK